MSFSALNNPNNPLEEIVSDEVYARLVQHGLLNEKGVRDFQMRKRFRAMRRRDTPAHEAIERLREEHPYLQFDTIRKIVYGLRSKQN